MSRRLPRGIHVVAATRNFPNGGYEASYRGPNGRERTRRFRRLADAERWLALQRADMARGTHVDPAAGKQRFIDFADEWAAGQDWKATTRDGWRFVRARLAAALGSMSLGSIDLIALQALQRDLAATYARTTVETTMSYAGSIMRAAFAAGRIGRDPTRGLRALKVRADERDGRVTPDDVPTRAEALAILTSAPARFRAAVALGLAGLRVGEVLGLTPDRVDLERRAVTVDRQLQRIGDELVLTTPKAEKKRTIVVPEVVAFELRRHVRDHVSQDVSGDVMFRGARGAMQRRDEFYKAGWHPALLAAGLAKDRFVFHSLRHFCASSLLAEGAPITAVAGHLGDTVETVSRTYAHWLRDDREVPAAVLERVLAAPSLASRAQ